MMRAGASRVGRGQRRDRRRRLSKKARCARENQGEGQARVGRDVVLKALERLEHLDPVVDAGALRAVDVRVRAIEQQVAHVHHVGALEVVDRIATGVAGTEVAALCDFRQLAWATILLTP